MLELAEDTSLPVLERANFLAIFASNLDEFFMVRVAGLKRRIVTGLAVPTNVGRSPAEVLSDISKKAHELQERHAVAYQELVKPALAASGIRVVTWDELGDDERAHLHDFFSNQIFPVLMPLAVDPAHPFPYISGLSLNLSVRVRNSRTGRQEFARVKVPQMLPRFVRVDPGEAIEDARYVTLEELIANHLGDLFPGMEIVEHHVFRVTRNEDVEIEEDETENLIKALEKELLRRRFGPPIRLEISDDMDEVTLGLLVRELDVTDQEVFRLPAPLDLGGLFDLARLDRPELHYPTHVPTTALQLQPSESNLRADVFKADLPPGRAAAPPLRVVRDERPGLPRAGRRRPRRARHQADAVPHVGRQPDRRGADRRGGVGQAGARPRRDQGAVRRAGQHLVGAQAREGRRARRLRARRASRRTASSRS